MRTRVSRALPPLLLLVLSVAACGYRDPARATQARAAAQTFISSCARDRPLTAMELLTEPLRDTFTRSGSPPQACARFLGVDPGRRSDEALLAAFRQTAILSVAVRGAAALVRLAVPAAPASAISLEFSEGQWRVDSEPGAA